MSVRKLPSGKWQGRVYDPSGREVSKNFDRKTDADRWEREQRRAKDRGEYVDPTDRTTVDEYARKWLADRRPTWRPGTAASFQGMIRTNITGDRIGALRLTAVQHSDVQNWVGRLVASGLAPRTVRNYTGMLGSMFRTAVRDGKRANSPAIGLRLPPIPHEEFALLSVAQVRQLAEAMSADRRAAVLVQAGLGLRVGELLALRVSDIDRERRTVRIDWQIDKQRRRVDLKTALSHRTIPLPKVVAVALAEHMLRHPPLDDGLIFYDHHRLPHVHTYRDWLTTIARRVRAVDPTFPEGISTHDLRHHYVSVLIHAGESVVAVGARIGDTPARVLETYAHIMPGTEENTRRAIDDAWSADPDEIDSAGG